jgi:two-component system, response regulator PdtaR
VLLEVTRLGRPQMSKDLETGNGIAVLVVDDEPFVRMDIAEILRRAGFQVEEASNSDEALRKLNGGACPLRALVTDVQMPGTITGYGLAKRVHDRFPQAAIVVISGVATPSPGEMPPNATFLAKPVIPERLVRAINEALAKPE